ncbi:DNA-processing protein DprA [Pseudohongiella sp. SYSU M77423]|uniref:DNA-processing protein DprA n=1 Tax=Pseudohongiella sp. SYSU M77423 TaxID=3042312 RepID=UPI0024803E89|nr:DNA-processing protein DprA [Pseudohongiella sp. SYSU M77423]MDH7944252.1 DNA-processing protein DprA [Pseudohongiella sp. SYSU M77423]
MMSCTDLESYLLLYHALESHANRMHRLLARAGSARGALELPVDSLQQLKLDDDVIQRIQTARDSNSRARQALEQTLRWRQQDEHSLVLFDDHRYPALLRELPDPPPVLFVRGDPGIFCQPCIALVGSRNCSRYGRDLAGRISRDLGRAGFTVVSGLASGIDTAAHMASVIQDKPTIAVLGNGLNTIYPKANAELASSISHGAGRGAVISEFPLHSPPDAFHFPQRNRIISGLSLAVCVIEATMRSGSLITARLALEQGRHVFAVPGSVNTPSSRGCHSLLRQGATLAENATDIIEQLAPMVQGQLELQTKEIPGNAVSNKAVSVPNGCTDLLRLIADDGVTSDALMSHSQLPLPSLNLKLLQLELSGHICKQAGKWFINR